MRPLPPWRSGPAGPCPLAGCAARGRASLGYAPPETGKHPEHRGNPRPSRVTPRTRARGALPACPRCPRRRTALLPQPDSLARWDFTQERTAAYKTEPRPPPRVRARFTAPPERLRTHRPPPPRNPASGRLHRPSTPLEPSLAPTRATTAANHAALPRPSPELKL
jgi:hypothetical protein